MYRIVLLTTCQIRSVIYHTGQVSVFLFFPKLKIRRTGSTSSAAQRRELAQSSYVKS